MLGVKDVFTTINCLGGAVAVCLCIDGRPFAAGIAVLLGYFLGDALDGPVARWTRTANAFGVEYDTIADHVAHCVAPAVITYTVYRDAALGLTPAATHAIAIALAALLLVAGSLRHARNRLVDLRTDGIWPGLPRTQVGFLAMSAANSAALGHVAGGAWIGIVLVPALCALSLSWIPFANHRPGRKHFWWVRVVIAVYIGSTLATLVVAPRFVFDVFFVWLFGYLFVSWAALTRAERDRYHRDVAAALAKQRPA